MKSSRPYLIKALYEWIVDNDCTPHLLVASEYPGVRVPVGYAKEGQIVLNVSPSAVRYLEMDSTAVSFEGRFGGVAQRLYIPTAAILAIYARENGQGMFFEADDFEDEVPEVDSTPVFETPEKPKGRPSLKIVK